MVKFPGAYQIYLQNEQGQIGLQAALQRLSEIEY